MLNFLTICFKFAFPIAYNLLLCIAKNIILYLSNITVSINITAVPNCNFQVNYNLFDNKVIIDKVSVYNNKLYIKPFAIPIFNSETKGIYLNTQSGFIAINNLNIYDIKNSLINLEINNINLYEVLKDDNYKNSCINGKVLIKVNGNEIKCDIRDLIIKNVKLNDINIGNVYLNGNYEQTDIGKNIKCNINQLNIKNSKFKNNSIKNFKLSGSINSNNIKENIACNINKLVINNAIVQDNSVDDLHFIGDFNSSNFIKDINCNIKKLNINNLKLLNNTAKHIHLIGTFNSKDLKKDINCSIQDLTVNNINFNKYSAENIHIIGNYSSNNINEDLNCNIKALNINNLILNNNSIGKLHLISNCESNDIKHNIKCKVNTLLANKIKFNNNIVDSVCFKGHYNSSNFKKNIDCNIKELTVKNIKIDKNTADNIQLIGRCNSTDFRKDIHCDIKNLTLNNIKVNDNSTSELKLSAICDSKDINQYIDCNINNLTCNKLRLKDINIGDLKIIGEYKNNNINCKVDLINLKHRLLCNGQLILGKNPKLDLLLKSTNPLILNNFKLNNDLTISTNCQYNTKLYHYKNNNTIDLNIKTSNNIVKGISLGNILLDGHYNNDILQCKLELNKWKHIINCNGKLKLEPKLYYNLNITNNSPLVLNNLEVATNVPININSNYKFNINNHNSNVNVNGNLQLNNCSVSQYLNNINANINLNNNILNIDNLQANIPSFVRGKLSVNGTINLDPKNNINTNCNIKLINGVITNMPVVKGTVDANLNLTGDITKNPLLKGDIIIRNPKADLTAILSGAMLSTQIIEKFVNKKPKNNNSNKVLLSPISTNINVKIDKILEANGPGLETTWKGGASVQCTKGQPINWSAKLNLLKGKYTIANKKLKLTSGECVANPNIKGLFTLMLAGKKKSNNDVVELKFIQKQNNTQIEFFSQPMKSKQDILALLLFDKYSSELSSAESYSLAMTIQSLTSGKGSIFSRVQNTLKIDSIELKDNTDKSGNEYKSISIGKKIGKYNINIERGKDNNSLRGSIERKLSKNTKVSVGAAKDSGVEARLVWYKRY